MICYPICGHIDYWNTTDTNFRQGLSSLLFTSMLNLGTAFRARYYGRRTRCKQFGLCCSLGATLTEELYCKSALERYVIDPLPLSKPGLQWRESCIRTLLPLTTCGRGFNSLPLCILRIFLSFLLLRLCCFCVLLV